MKNLFKNGVIRGSTPGIFFLSFSITLLLLNISCTTKHTPFAFPEFSGIENVYNFTKYYLSVQNKWDSINPVPIAASNGDMLVCEESFFVYDESSAQKVFSVNLTDSELYVNNKIYSISIPGNENMIPWFQDMGKKDLSSLQILNFDSKPLDSYLPYFRELAKIKPDPGISFNGSLGEMSDLLKIFNPRYIIGPTLEIGEFGPAVNRGEYGILSGLTNLEVLMITPKDSVVNDPLPALPSLKQVFILNMDEKVILTNDLLTNNSQIEKVIIVKSGLLDLSILNPLDNLKELIISGTDSILNVNLINNHKYLEVLSGVENENGFDQASVRLPSLRWFTFSSNVSQAGFDSFINSHPVLEIVEVFENDIISSFAALSGLPRLEGLTVTDTLTDIASVKNLSNLKYLSLPDSFLDDPVNRAEIRKSLPGTLIVANEGFCLGSGWLLLLIPLIFFIRFLGKHIIRKPYKGI